MEARFTPKGWQKRTAEVSGHILPEGERTEPNVVGKAVSQLGPCGVVWHGGKELVSEPEDLDLRLGSTTKEERALGSTSWS